MKSDSCVCCIFVSSVYLALRMENGLMSMRRSIARVVSFVLWYLPYGPNLFVISLKFFSFLFSLSFIQFTDLFLLIS